MRRHDTFVDFAVTTMRFRLFHYRFVAHFFVVFDCTDSQDDEILRLDAASISMIAYLRDKSHTKRHAQTLCLRVPQVRLEQRVRQLEAEFELLGGGAPQPAAAGSKKAQ